MSRRQNPKCRLSHSRHLPEGMNLAQDQIQKMRIDAQKLPGEFEDLRNIFTTIAIPGFNAGANPDQLRETAAKLMATGKIAQLPMDMVAREAANLMSGRAGSHNVLGVRLMGLTGAKATQFNALSDEERLKRLNTELDKYKDSIDEFGKSFEGLSSTSVDIAKQVGTIASAPLFDHVKALLTNINNWATENRGLINSWAQFTGEKVAGAFDCGVEAVRRWGPAVYAFASNATDAIVGIWHAAEPWVERIASILESALKAPWVAELVTGLVVAAGAWKTIRGVTSGVSTVWKGVGGIAEAAGNTSIGSTLLGGAVEAAGGGMVGFGAALATAGASLAMIGGVAFATYEALRLFQDLNKDARSDYEAALDAADRFGQVLADSPLEDFSNKAYDADNMLANLTVSGYGAAEALSNIGWQASESMAQILTTRQAAERHSNEARDIANFGLDRMAEIITADHINSKNNKDDVRHPGGGGGTHIQKVEIVVTSNQDPGRVAREVGGELQKLQRRPRKSADVTNWGLR
jgi:hypothetical protein